MESWAQLATRFRSYRQVRPALANADLLDAAGARWSGHVDVHSSMHDLRFVPPGEDFFALRSVRVSFRTEYGDGGKDQRADGVFSFELWLPAANNPRVTVLRSADKASGATAPTVLDAFLMQLTSDDGRMPSERLRPL